MTDQILACSACGQTTKDGLELMPSGKSFKRHSFAGETCKGGQPQSYDPEPIKVVKKSTPDKVSECVECGEEQPALKTPGKVRKHTNPETKEVCEQRESVEARCPICESSRILKKMKLPIHKDPKAKTRCPGSTRTLKEAAELGKSAPEGKAKLPKQRSAQAAAYRALTPLERSVLKATKLGNELKEYEHPWRFTVEKEEPDCATLVLKRGTGNNLEEMRISWWGGACIGGDGKITHTFRGRTIAVRNANAVRQRAKLSPEEVQQEYSKVSTRKSAPRGPRTKKTAEEMRELMPFDPKTAEDDTILKAILGKEIKWHRTTDGKEEKDVVKGKPRITKTKTGIRNLSFTGMNTSRTVRVENLVSVG